MATSEYEVFDLTTQRYDYQRIREQTRPRLTEHTPTDDEILTRGEAQQIETWKQDDSGRIIKAILSAAIWATALLVWYLYR